ncbi:MAG: malate synthase A [Sandaracinaceae bacterium]|nr:malate synthase A [Sandaracinaceae bacterium]
MTERLDLPARLQQQGVRLTLPVTPAVETVLTPEATAFVVDLVRTFRDRVEERLAARRDRHAAFARGELPAFLATTRTVRESDWTVAPLPADLLDRRVEITGPVERKMIINALNSGASCFMADFEDSNAPTWANCIDGQVNLRDAVRRTITFVAEDTGKRYALADRTAVLLVRPRGWHLFEKHFLVDERPAPAGLFDFGLYLFHNAKELMARGSGPYFYLPKMESHLEARLWNDVFLRAQEKLGVPAGTIKATVLIETLPAAFEMDEILHELRQHSSGLNCGRWDYIFSYIKTCGHDASRVVPDRGVVGMTQPFMRAYTQLVIKTCHRRNVHAMGGMAAQIPIKNDPEANEQALAKVRADKLREVTDGHDGTWVAHPGLVPIAKAIFDEHMRTPNQIARRRDDVHATEQDLLRAPEGARTEQALRHNVRVGVQYIEAWLGGNGCVPLYSLMEDAATAEISRAQIWQWLHHQVALDGGAPLTKERLRAVLEDEMDVIRRELGAARFEAGRFAEAKELFFESASAEPLVEFLTLPAYERLLAQGF